MGKKTEYKILPKAKDPSFRRIEGNYPAKKYKKGTPAITRLSFEFQGPGTQYIDVAKALSAVNRRLYRQGCYYYIQSVEYYDNSNHIVDLHTIPDTWSFRSAYRRGKHIFNEMIYKLIRNQPAVLGKYHDFKVFMNNQHHEDGTSASPSMYHINGAEMVVEGEWNYSQFASADDDGNATQLADRFHVTMLGDNDGGGTPNAPPWDSVSLMESYVKTRNKPNQLGEPTLQQQGLLDDPLTHLFDYSSEEQINALIEIVDDEGNDDPPYNKDVHVGQMVNGDGAYSSQRIDQMQQVARLACTDAGGRVAIAGGFCAPLGLICVDPSQTDSETKMADTNKFRIVLNIAQGTYHGVYAEAV